MNVPAALPPVARTLLRGAFATSVAGIVLLVAQDATAFGGAVVEGAFDGWVLCLLWALPAAACLARGVLVAEQRATWLAFGAGLALGAAGMTAMTAWVRHLDPIPYPSVADALWLAVYPFTYAGLVLLARASVRGLRPGLWLDGIIGGLTLSAFVAALIVTPLRRLLDGTTAAVATNLTYPTLSLVLLGLVVAVVGATGWRPGRALTLVAFAFALQVAVDCVYLVQAGDGDYQPGTLVSAGWPLVWLVVAVAAWQPTTEARPARAEGWTVICAPWAFAALAVALLVYGNVERLPAAAVALAVATLVGAGIRGTLTLNDMRLLFRRGRQALIDSLTGLRNHRAFHEELEETLAEHDRSGEALGLVMLDLVGLKAVNDAAGHQEGDERLRRLAATLAATVRAGDGAYRVGGDEFMVVLPGAGAWGAFRLAQRLGARLADEGLAVTAGVAERAPGAAKDALLREAGLALAEAKRANRNVVLYSPALEPAPAAPDPDARQEHLRTLATSLARAVDAKDSSTRSHCETVSEMCGLVAVELDLPPDRVERIRLAGLLHDVGKIGIADAILRKPGRLTDEEFEVMRTHAPLGHSIVSGADLPEEAHWILHHHERMDGGGYPDGLAGGAIPLESRIILVADAFEAMTAHRPYRPGMPESEAFAELARHAGTQFDPACVEALRRALAGAPARAA